MTIACSLLLGCMVGPNFKQPTAPVAKHWVGPATTQVSTDTSQQADWWKSFNDPVLDKLIETAYHQNLTLQVAGLRVLEARANRGIAVGQFFPQLQQLNGSYSHNGVSRNDPIAVRNRYFDSTSAAFDVGWELDVWGKFRRGIESSDASLYSSVMNYDDALVTLVADVATTYVTLRGIDERIRLAQQNVTVQQQALDIANVRFRAGGTSELDVQQAKAQLANTQALVPSFQLLRKQAQYQLCVLLGMPPDELTEILGTEPAPIPLPPENVAVGIPAELLRRRPDIRRAEADAEAQSALIGVAAADLLPHFQLFGTIGYSAENPGDLFNASNLVYQMGPSFRWDILNYGRIINGVRAQDARFEQTLAQYQNTVLVAQQDVENSISGFIYSKDESVYLNDSVAASLRSVDLSFTQYRAGGADFIRVLDATQFLVDQQDALVISQISTATSVIALNRALGGGWEMRQGNEFVAPETIERMRHRTNWGDITSSSYDSGSDVVLFPRRRIDPTATSNDRSRP
jgi:NodT family efflux transporter outer membrane factor (OMF) lipoprotein